MRSRKELYKYHVANLRAIERAINQVGLVLRNAVSVDDDGRTYSFVCLYALLLGAWAETRLWKVLLDANAFDARARMKICAFDALLDRWLATVEIAFRKHYHIPSASLTEVNLPHTAFSRYQSLDSILKNDLRSVIEIRNKLAHGQWSYPLNSSCSDVATGHMRAIRQENVLSLQTKRRVLNYLARIIHDLAVSKPTFERDFDDTYRKLAANRQLLQTQDYAKYANMMQEKHRRGRLKKRAEKAKRSI